MSSEPSSVVASTLLENAHTIPSSDTTDIQWIELGAGAPLLVSPPLGIPLASWVPALSRLALQFRVLFVLSRGSIEGPLPGKPSSLTVRRRAADLVELVSHLQFQSYYMLAHSSGVGPLVAALSTLQLQPKRVCLVSSRFTSGPSIQAEKVLSRALVDPGFRALIQASAVGYAPPSVAHVVRERLQHFDRLAALLRAFDYSRAFECPRPFPAAVPCTFVMAERDPNDVRETSVRYSETIPSELRVVVDVANAGHFFIQESGENAAELIARCLLGEVVLDAGNVKRTGESISLSSIDGHKHRNCEAAR